MGMLAWLAACATAAVDDHGRRRLRCWCGKGGSALAVGVGFTGKLIVHIFYILFITLLHLSCNKSANFLVLNIFFCRR